MLFCMASQLPLVPLTFALFVLFINWINIFQFWFLDCPFLFLSVLRGFPILIQATGHMWSGRDVVWIFVSLPPDHICPLGRISFKDVNLVKPVHESDRFLFPSTFQQSSIRFACCNVQIGVRWPDEINFLQWNWEWFFSWHEKLNSWFNMTTTKWNLLELTGSLSASSFFSSGWISSMSRWDSPLRFSLSLWWVPVSVWVGFRNSWSLPDNFAEPSATRNTNSPIFWGYQSNFCIQSSRTYFWCIQLSNPPISAIRMSSFQIDEFLALSLSEFGRCSTSAPNGIFIL